MILAQLFYLPCKDRKDDRPSAERHAQIDCPHAQKGCCLALCCGGCCSCLSVLLLGPQVIHFRRLVARTRLARSRIALLDLIEQLLLLARDKRIYALLKQRGWLIARPDHERVAEALKGHPALLRARQPYPRPADVHRIARPCHRQVEIRKRTAKRLHLARLRQAVCLCCLPDPRANGFERVAITAAFDLQCAS
ncbi:hypothetical protein T492DRAFT_297675 [Pavlovales sp. CCMP2436]|nr:hypothetical protein T492DRAFT_297675 [Pavlovales sp. CCMP2436]